MAFDKSAFLTMLQALATRWADEFNREYMINQIMYISGGTTLASPVNNRQYGLSHTHVVIAKDILQWLSAIPTPATGLVAKLQELQRLSDAAQWHDGIRRRKDELDLVVLAALQHKAELES